MVIKKWVVFVFFAIIFLTPTVSNVMGSYSPDEGRPTTQVALPDVKIVSGIVKNGDTASTLLNQYLPMKTIYEITRQSADIFPLRHIRKGQSYKVILQEGTLTGFEYDIDKETRFVIQKENHNFSINQVPIAYDVSLEVISSTITSTLFEAIRTSGEGGELAWKLSDIFAWDIDFMKDIQPHDQFQVLVEKRYHNGKFAGYGRIQAAIFTNRGTIFKAFLHKGSNGVPGYYDENGRSLQKAFLKAPLSFSRISSKFSPKRMHPVLKTYHSHPGVDYAAPMGTPIKTVGDGIITRIGFSKTTGNRITIRHCSGYTTQYYHMSKFAVGMKNNKQVRQGEIIGYVGMTGYATGPHLCFRIQKNGKPVDPLAYKSPLASPINPNEMEQFRAKAQNLSQKILAAHKPDASHKKSV